MTTLRTSETQLRARIAALEEALRVSNAKLSAKRESEEHLRQRLEETMRQAKEQLHELARVRNVAKRLRERYDALREQLGLPANDDAPAEVDETAQR
ncbi:MAG: hypothetical protein R3C16_12885 [Hyphomonadaceae bacterium]